MKKHAEAIKEPYFHYVQIDEQRCNGCVLCMKACPTKAIRVESRKVAHIQGVCIDCGECIRVCPRRAIKAMTVGGNLSRLSPHTAIGASPVLYLQFGENVMPNEVLTALHRTFRYVYDQGYYQELHNIATEIYIRENRKKEGAVWPLISPICPVVNRLIALRFPSLLTRITPMIPAREIAARELKRRLQAEGVSKDGEIHVYHVTPCSAKMMSIRKSMFLESSYLDGALGINEVYETVLNNLKLPGDQLMLHQSGGIVIGWAASGGEIAGLNEGNYMAVSGLDETIRYLEKIEMGLFGHIEYFELRACIEGCIGGPMTVADKYQAKSTLRRLVRVFGEQKKVQLSDVVRPYQEGWFFRETFENPLQEVGHRISIPGAIERQERIEQICRELPRKECGLCGAPDCRTFAEDVADGKAALEACILMNAKPGRSQ